MIVIGGGDTGADCIGTSLRHGATSIVNFELFAPPPAERAANNPWPQWPRIFRVDYSHAEVKADHRRRPPRLQHPHQGIRRRRQRPREGRAAPSKSIGRSPSPAAPRSAKSPAAKRVWPADLVLLATGFVGPELTVGEMLGVTTVEPRRGWQTFAAEHGKFATNVEGVFAAGDCRRGQSPRRLGDQRRPRRRPRDRRVPDGLHEPAGAGDQAPEQVV